MQYWDKFVADVLCTKGAPDYGQQNTVVNIFFEYESDAAIAAGVTQSHIAYSRFDGYCNSSKVNVGVDWRSWTEMSLLKRLWVMYHEFGHDVYRYEHSPDPADIMYYSINQGFIKIIDFIFLLYTKSKSFIGFQNGMVFIIILYYFYTLLKYIVLFIFINY